MNQVRGNKGFIVVVGVVLMLGILFLLRSMELKGTSPVVQPANQALPTGWTRVTAASLPVFIYEDGQLKTLTVLSAGDRMRVAGQAQGMLVVGLDDGRKAVVTPVIDGKPTTELGEGWKILPETNFP